MLHNNKWSFNLNGLDEKLNMPPLFEFIYNFFVEIFGPEIMTAESCLVYNDPLGDCPMLITNHNPILLRTNVSSLLYWSQYIYQLSHELTHYAIRQQKEDKDLYLRWFEETICEAMSMYILNISAQRWHECQLSNQNPGYNQSINSYLDDIYKNTKVSVLKQCDSIDSLRNIEQTCTIDRNERSMERNYLYETFMAMPDDIKTIIFYTQYIQQSLFIDFERWIVSDNTNSEFINRLYSIQPNIYL